MRGRPEAAAKIFDPAPVWPKSSAGLAQIADRSVSAFAPAWY
jgi:hypothetical protein